MMLVWRVGISYVQGVGGEKTLGLSCGLST